MEWSIYENEWDGKNWLFTTKRKNKLNKHGDSVRSRREFKKHSSIEFTKNINKKDNSIVNSKLVFNVEFFNANK